MVANPSVEPPIQIALALLRSPLRSSPRSPSSDSPGFLMQLRDDLPNIPCPGQWGLFGGHLDPGETADACIHRELVEEIGRDIPQLDLYRVVEEARLIRHMYHGVLTV
ncbi:MAG: NUDIX domain-containing protein, partial [Cyanobacteria bacterium P01_H01_bin.130]